MSNARVAHPTDRPSRMPEPLPEPTTRRDQIAQALNLARPGDCARTSPRWPGGAQIQIARPLRLENLHVSQICDSMNRLLFRGFSRKFALDSSLEGTGFETSVPLKVPPSRPRLLSSPSPSRFSPSSKRNHPFAPEATLSVQRIREVRSQSRRRRSHRTEYSACDRGGSPAMV